MKSARTTFKDIELKIALVEQSYADIKRRLEQIEFELEKISSIISHGVGAWKGLLLLISIAATILAIIKQI